jgi:hypothetical protein
MHGRTSRGCCRARRAAAVGCPLPRTKTRCRLPGLRTSRGGAGSAGRLQLPSRSAGSITRGTPRGTTTIQARWSSRQDGPSPARSTRPGRTTTPGSARSRRPWCPPPPSHFTLPPSQTEPMNSVDRNGYGQPLRLCRAARARARLLARLAPTSNIFQWAMTLR